MLQLLLPSTARGRFRPSARAQNGKKETTRVRARAAILAARDNKTRDRAQKGKKKRPVARARVGAPIAQSSHLICEPFLVSIHPWHHAATRAVASPPPICIRLSSVCCRTFPSILCILPIAVHPLSSVSIIIHRSRPPKRLWCRQLNQPSTWSFPLSAGLSCSAAFSIVCIAGRVELSCPFLFLHSDPCLFPVDAIACVVGPPPLQ